MFKILVVDDDKNSRKLLKTVLEEERYIVYTAVDGIEALNIIDKEYVDLIVLDIMMPNMDGYEFTKLLRENNNNLPILMISAKQLSTDMKKGFIVGIDDYMTKPIDEEEFILRIKALMRRSQIVNEKKMTIGKIVLDYNYMTVTREDEVIELTQKEFLLLFKLLSYPGKIFTRIQLMDEIWGTTSDTGWETLTVHIGRLRKKFDDWEEFKIESVRGLGYRAVKKV